MIDRRAQRSWQSLSEEVRGTLREFRAGHPAVFRLSLRLPAETSCSGANFVLQKSKSQGEKQVKRPCSCGEDSAALHGLETKRTGGRSRRRRRNLGATHLTQQLDEAGEISLQLLLLSSHSHLNPLHWILTFRTHPPCSTRTLEQHDGLPQPPQSSRCPARHPAHPFPCQLWSHLAR